MIVLNTGSAGTASTASATFRGSGSRVVRLRREHEQDGVDVGIFSALDAESVFERPAHAEHVDRLATLAAVVAGRRPSSASFVGRGQLQAGVPMASRR